MFLETRQCDKISCSQTLFFFLCQDKVKQILIVLLTKDTLDCDYVTGSGNNGSPFLPVQGKKSTL